MDAWKVPGSWHAAHAYRLTKFQTAKRAADLIVVQRNVPFNAKFVLIACSLIPCKDMCGLLKVGG